MKLLRAASAAAVVLLSGASSSVRAEDGAVAPAALDAGTAPPAAPAAPSAEAVAAPLQLTLRPLEPEGLPRARLSPDEPPTAHELADLQGLRAPSCSLALGALFPGVGSLCTGHRLEGELLIGAGLLELGSGLALGFSQGFSTSAAEVPLLAFGDLFTATTMDATLRVQRAKRLLYVPQESLGESFSAPFRLEVLRQPDVLLGIVGTVGLGLLFEQFLDGGLSTSTLHQRPQLFGQQVNSAVGYPLAGAIGVGVFAQVATAEELAFRGLLQSSLARSNGETAGWLEGSLIFGLFHATNALLLAPDQRVDYLTRSVPYITLVGSYLGYTYMNHQYSLSPSIAVHFWYDFLIEAVAFVLDPKNSPLSYVQVF